MTPPPLQLRVDGERAVLSGEQELAPETLPLGADLAAALHEWARVAAAVRKAAAGGGSPDIADPGDATVGVISRRGHQLAGRVATEMHVPVHYVDPVTDIATVVVPHSSGRTGGAHRPRRASRAGGGLFRSTPGEPTPWGTGLTVSAFLAAVVLVGMLALMDTLAENTTGWLALAAVLVVTVGMAPSLWLGRRIPIVRWACLGAAVGLAASWLGLLFVLL